jgi:hypothetical protein
MNASPMPAHGCTPDLLRGNMQSWVLKTAEKRVDTRLAPYRFATFRIDDKNVMNLLQKYKNRHISAMVTAREKFCHFLPG